MAKSKLTPEVKSKIEEVAALDGTVEEMAYYTGLSRQTIYNYLDPKSPFFDKNLFENVERLRLKPILAARMRAVKGATESYQNAVDYLKRKKVDEFGDKKGVDITSNGESLPVTGFLYSSPEDN